MGSSLTGVTALCLPSLVLVQPKKTRPDINERLLIGRKESNQTKQNLWTMGKNVGRNKIQANCFMFSYLNSEIKNMSIDYILTSKLILLATLWKKII